MKMKNLHKLPIEYLWEGLVLKDNIYDSTGYTLLIPKGEVLTGEKLRKLYNFNKGAGMNGLQAITWRLSIAHVRNVKLKG